jgi:hypothetical protein
MKPDWIILTSVTENVLFRGIGAYIVADSLRKLGLTVQVIDFTDYFSKEELLEAV